MIGEGWVVDFSIVTATGNVKQLYPDWASVGVDPAGATLGQLIRKPCGGQCTSIQILTDGSNGGTLELWDFNADDEGIDVSSTDVITNAQINAAVTAGRAKKIHEQNFIASSETPINIGPFRFNKGLAARIYNASGTGTASLNLKVSGGFRKTEKIG